MTTFDPFSPENMEILKENKVNEKIVELIERCKSALAIMYKSIISPHLLTDDEKIFVDKVNEHEPTGEHDKYVSEHGNA